MHSNIAVVPATTNAKAFRPVLRSSRLIASFVVGVLPLAASAPILSAAGLPAPDATRVADGNFLVDGFDANLDGRFVTGMSKPEGSVYRWIGFVAVIRNGTNGLQAYTFLHTKKGKRISGTGKILPRFYPLPQAARSLSLASVPVAAAASDDASGGALAGSRASATIVGFYDNGFNTPYHAFLWVPDTTAVDLGTLDPPNDATRSSFANAVSDDGAVVVGFSDVAGGTTQHAFRWTQAGGMIDLGTGAGAATDRSSRAYGVSGDGSVVIGESDFPGGFSGTVKQAFRWTSAGGFQNLGAVETDFPSSANAVTGDGAVVVGMSGVSVTVGNSSTNGSRAFRWTQSGGMQDLGALPGHTYSAATGVSDDGTIVVGISSDAPIDRLSVGGTYRYANDPAHSRAFRWTAATDMKEVTQQLADAGLDVTGIAIAGATGISTDGAWMFGDATLPTTAANETEAALFTLDAPDGPESRLLNLSTRGLAQSGDNVLIPGLVLSGAANKKMLIRAVGPTLNDPGIGFPGTTIPDPTMQLKRLDTSVNPAVYVDYDANDDWGTNTNAATITNTAASLGAFAFKSAKESALLVDLPAGQYSVIARDRNDASGIAIVELYDADDASVDSRLINISNRGFCGVGDQVMIPGFVISSEGPKTLLVRVVGPTLDTLPRAGHDGGSQARTLSRRRLDADPHQRQLGRQSRRGEHRRGRAAGVRVPARRRQQGRGDRRHAAARRLHHHRLRRRWHQHRRRARRSLRRAVTNGCAAGSSCSMRMARLSRR